MLPLLLRKTNTCYTFCVVCVCVCVCLCVCVDCFYLRCLSNIATVNNHMASSQVKEQVPKDDKSAGLQKYYVWRPLNYWQCEQLHHLTFRICVTCLNRLGLQKLWSGLSILYSLFICPKRRRVHLFLLH